MKLEVYVVTFLVSAMGIYGDALLKIAGQSTPTRWLYCYAGAALYALTAFGWFFVLQRAKIAAVIGVLYPAFQAITVTFVGVYYFDEGLNRREVAGMVLATLAAVLLAQGEEVR